MRLKKADKEDAEILGLNPKYIYDDGFGPKVYHCTNWNCDSVNLREIPQGGFVSPHYECQDCDAMGSSPKWTQVSELIEKVSGLVNLINSYRCQS